MAQWYEVKVRGRLDGEEGGQNEITLLNRRVRWYGQTIEFEADPKHVSTLCEAFELCGKSAGSETPIVKETKEEVTAPDEEPCGKDETTRFRALAATGNYLAQDRLDEQ